MVTDLLSIYSKNKTRNIGLVADFFLFSWPVLHNK